MTLSQQKFFWLDVTQTNQYRELVRLPPKEENLASSNLSFIAYLKYLNTIQCSQVMHSRLIPPSHPLWEYSLPITICLSSVDWMSWFTDIQKTEQIFGGSMPSRRYFPQRKEKSRPNPSKREPSFEICTRRSSQDSWVPCRIRIRHSI